MSDDVGCGDVGTGASVGNGPGSRFGVVPSPRCDIDGDVFRAPCRPAVFDDAELMISFESVRLK